MQNNVAVIATIIAISPVLRHAIRVVKIVLSGKCKKKTSVHNSNPL